MIINYDEGGQFFDHHWSPNPPMGDWDGKSTVTVEGELIKESYDLIASGNSIGMGFRVPLFVISPWSRHKGGAVYSEVTDHTSVLKLVEKRFNITVPTISPWRRAVAGDLTHAFNFSAPDYSWPDLPSTDGDFEKSK
jgi:phospholipase C